MNKAISSTISKKDVKNIISLSTLKNLRQSKEPTLTVEIEKQPTALLKNSLWIGDKNGGMASWLSTLIPHLPHRKFCLFMNENSYHDCQYVYSYYSQYFEKLFHKEYVGTCIYPRKFIDSKEMNRLNQITAKQLPQYLVNSSDENRITVILDLRGAQAAQACTIKKLIRQFKNTLYINLPLNDEDFAEILSQKTCHLPANTRFITMCAKGYRSMIGYSLLNLLKKSDWEIKLCRCTSAQIKECLSKPQQFQFYTQSSEEVFSLM